MLADVDGVLKLSNRLSKYTKTYFYGGSPFSTIKSQHKLEDLKYNTTIFQMKAKTVKIFFLRPISSPMAAFSWSLCFFHREGK